MQILLDPNVAYVVLVLGFLLAFLAVLVPGTGLIEVFALFTLILAAYAIYNLQVNFLALGVLVLGVFPFLLALRRSRQLIYLALSILALVIGSAFLFVQNGWQPLVSPVLAVIVSPLVTIFLWITARKALDASLKPPSHHPDRLIGLVGAATTGIDGNGTVQMESELWSARSERFIPAGSEVRVVGREGLTLVVEKV